MTIKVFRYRSCAAKWMVAAILIWMFAVLAFALLWFYPYDRPVYLYRVLIVAGLAIPPVVVLAYMIVVSQTAILMADKKGLAYRDRFVRVNVKWTRIVEFTERCIKDSEGRKVFFKLGIRNFEQWETLQQLVIDQAALTDVRLSCRCRLEYARRPTGDETV